MRLKQRDCVTASLNDVPCGAEKEPLSPAPPTTECQPLTAERGKLRAHTLTYGTGAHLSIRAMMMFFTFTFWCSSAQARRKGFSVCRWNSSGNTCTSERGPRWEPQHLTLDSGLPHGTQSSRLWGNHSAPTELSQNTDCEASPGTSPGRSTPGPQAHPQGPKPTGRRRRGAALPDAGGGGGTETAPLLTRGSASSAPRGSPHGCEKGRSATRAA